MNQSVAAFTSAAQALAAALLAATTDPADALRLLALLAVVPASAGAVPGSPGADMQGAVSDLFRRAAVVALARASATYQPASYDDAANVRAQVTALLDQEIAIAGDQGADATYMALRTLRMAVVQDLTARGASLAPIANFTVGANMPALALATRIYGDPTRSDELVTQVNPVHPAFMPASFRALGR